MRWLMLPVSVGAHVIAALAILIVPLAAEVEWPTPAPLHSALVTTIAPVPPEVVKLAAPRRTVAAPSVAPAFARSRERDVRPSREKSRRTRSPQALRSRRSCQADIGSSVGDRRPDRARSSATRPTGAGASRPGRARAEENCGCDAGVSTDRTQCRIEGAVILEAVINERGEIERVKVLRSQPLLDAAAVDAVGAGATRRRC